MMVLDIALPQQKSSFAEWAKHPIRRWALLAHEWLVLFSVLAFTRRGEERMSPKKKIPGEAREPVVVVISTAVSHTGSHQRG
jgi:hypothetical protein